MKYKRGECTKQNLPVFLFQGYQLYLTFLGKQPCFRKSKIHFSEKYINFATSVVFY